MKGILLILSLWTVGTVASAQEWLPDGLYPSEKRVQITEDADYSYYFSESLFEKHWQCFHIRFFEKKRMYSMDYTTPLSEDISTGFHLSSGTFERNGKHIRLCDTSTGLKMRAEVRGDSIIITDGYKPIENKFFIPSQWRRPTNIFVLSDNRYLKGARDSLYKLDSPLVVPGDYYGKEGFRLHLEENDFSYHYDVVLILKGTWMQKGNFIILHDEHTNHDFYLVSDGLNLRSMLLPGDEDPNKGAVDGLASKFKYP